MTELKWKNLMEEFRLPESFYRGAPFWAWNGKLETEELRRQVRVMQQMGLGGFFMHSRVGLDTAYLSDEWFSCIRACAEEAERNKMYAWLYDEDRWPSGAAGGLVTRDVRFRMRHLVLTITRNTQDLKWRRETIAAFVGKINGRQASQLRPVPPKQRVKQLAPDESLLLFSVRISQPSPWYNGYTYLDTLNPEAVREFLRVTYQAYRQRCGRFFGRSIPGIFTDEPNYGSFMGHLDRSESTFVIPWTEKLPQVFRKRYGYDLLPHLPEIFFDVEGQPVTPACYHYHDCITHLFVDSFSRQIGQWCGRNKLLFTGHVLAEDTLASQTSVVGNCMRFYEYMQAPGMDLLTERRRDFITAKQVSSAARQFGRKWRLTETYGCTGWDFPFAGHKALGDWQVALGINLRCQHLSWYTMLGQAKRDYPAAISYQSPWWHLYPEVEDYFARVLSVMTRGEEVRDLLVIHPIESMWVKAKINMHNDPDVKNYDLLFSQLTNFLLANHLDFDYGDEELLSRHSRVKQQKGEPLLIVGKATYRVVLVPPLVTMRRSTLKLLEKFLKSGGKVVFLGQVASYVEAAVSEEAKTVANRCVKINSISQELLDALQPDCRRVSITDNKGKELTSILYLLRQDQDFFYLFICNTGEDFTNSTEERYQQIPVRERRLACPEVIIKGFPDWPQPAVELDPEKGCSFLATNRATSSGWEILTDLPPLASRLFIIPRKKPVAVPAKPVWKEVSRKVLNQDFWEIKLSEPNVLVLDRPGYRLGKEDWQPPEEILRLDRIIRARLGIPPRGGAMVQPWARKKNPRTKKLSFILSYTFQVEEIPTGQLLLALERPDLYTITLNGEKLSSDMASGWWVDKSLSTLSLDPACLRAGANQIVLEGEYDENHPGLETIYLLGNFGVKLEGTCALLTRPPEKLPLGDWTQYQFPFYAGCVAYQTRIPVDLQSGQRLVVNIPDYRAVAVRILVDGKTAGVIAWEPNEVDITDSVSGKTEVQLTVEIVGHRRNSHGPLHLNEKWPVWTGPEQFTPKDEQWYEGYQLVPCGLMAPPEIIVREAS